MSELVVLDIGKMKEDLLVPYFERTKENTLKHLSEENLSANIGCAVMATVEDYIVGRLIINQKNNKRFGDSFDTFLSYHGICEEKGKLIKEETYEQHADGTVCECD